MDLLTSMIFGAVSAGFAGLALWQARDTLALPQHKMLFAAFGFTSVWAFVAMKLGFGAPEAVMAEGIRNIGWLGFMLTLGGLPGQRRQDRNVALVYVVLAFVVIVQMVIAGLQIGELMPAVSSITALLHMISAVGALVLVHNLYLSVEPDQRGALTLPVAALAVMWLTDLNVYTIGYFSHGLPDQIELLRAGVTLALVPVFGVVMMRAQDWRFSVSRRVAFRSFSLVLIGAYLAAVMLVTWGLSLIGGNAAQIAQIAFVLGTATAGLALFPSASFQAWLKVKVAKNFYAHRYDYREEWIRFTGTMGQPGNGNQPLQARVIKALADIADSPGGVLLVPDGAGGLIEKASWNWSGGEIPVIAGGADFTSALQQTGHIVDFSAAGPIATPYWMTQETQLWVAVPLLHYSDLAGVILLEKPLIDRPLDWEDLDMFRVAGRQAASYLAEEAGQTQLADARQFDEFNRRFAFMMHDIKNVVSQLSLVAKNAEKHAENPEFRADMVATLKGSADKMNLMLTRLSQHGKVVTEPVRPVVLLDLIDAIARDFRGRHPVVVMRDAEPIVLADPHRLEQALTHLVQNATEASDAAEPVTLVVREGDGRVMIDIIDRGVGMTPNFVANELFKPFTSIKAGGFGIGAYEARSLVQSMSGQLAVQSAPGVGTHFTITLPQALGMSIKEKRA